MILHTQLLDFLAEEFSELKGNVPVMNTSVFQCHRLVGSLARLTQELIDLGDFALVKCCFGLADQLLSRGDAVLQHAVETDFLPLLHLDWPGSHNAVARRLLPVTLKKAFYALIHPPLAC